MFGQVGDGFSGAVLSEIPRSFAVFYMFRQVLKRIWVMCSAHPEDLRTCIFVVCLCFVVYAIYLFLYFEEFRKSDGVRRARGRAESEKRVE